MTNEQFPPTRHGCPDTVDYDWTRPMPEVPVTDWDNELHHLFLVCVMNPGDDTPRLVMADKLEELGHVDRAKLIRDGCELNGMRRSFNVTAKVMGEKIGKLMRSEVEIIRGCDASEADERKYRSGLYPPSFTRMGSPFFGWSLETASCVCWVGGATRPRLDVSRGFVVMWQGQWTYFVDNGLCRSVLAFPLLQRIDIEEFRPNHDANVWAVYRGSDIWTPRDGMPGVLPQGLYARVVDEAKRYGKLFTEANPITLSCRSGDDLTKLVQRTMADMMREVWLDGARVGQEILAPLTGRKNKGQGFLYAGLMIQHTKDADAANS